MTEQPTQPTEQAPPDTEPDASDSLGDAGKRALTAERQRAAAYKRQADEWKARLDAIEAEKLSDIEKAQKAANEATQRAADLERAALRYRVAVEKGVPASLVDRLRGDTEDEVAADADSLLELVNAPRSPKPDLSQGPKGEPVSAAPRDQFAAFIQQGA